MGSTAAAGNDSLWAKSRLVHISPHHAGIARKLAGGGTKFKAGTFPLPMPLQMAFLSPPFAQGVSPHVYAAQIALCPIST